MRMSVDEQDPGYANWRAFRPFRVMLDGKVLERVRTVNSDSNEAVIYSVDAQGRTYMNEAKTAVATETVRGAITFELISPNRPT